MGAVCGLAGFGKHRFRAIEHARPVVYAGEIDGKTLKHGHGDGTLLAGDDAILADRGERDALAAAFIDVAALWIAGHDDPRPFLMHTPLVDVAKRPIVEAVGGKVADACRRIGIMAAAAGKARMQHADIDPIRDRCAKRR